MIGIESKTLDMLHTREPSQATAPASRALIIFITLLRSFILHDDYISFNLFLKTFSKVMFVCLWICAWVCRYPWRSEELELLELELWVFVSLLTWVSEAELRSSAKAVSMFNSEPYPQPLLYVLKRVYKSCLKFFKFISTTGPLSSFIFLNGLNF